jgi:peroxiredoxin
MKVLSMVTTALMAGYASGFAAVAPGDKIPAVDLHRGFPPDMVNIAEYTAGRKVAVVGLPGAFTPTW